MVDLNVRPVFLYSEKRLRAHDFLCMLDYYVEWHMRQRMKPLLFNDEQLYKAGAGRASAVAKGGSLRAARGKDKANALMTDCSCLASRLCSRLCHR